MAEMRSPRKLRDVSHLFLSGARAGAGVEERREPACVWLLATGASTNRAHLAAGLATALSRQGMCVSLAEAVAGLPDVGFYFGDEPEAYLLPAFDRGAIETGTWNGSIRFCYSGSLSALARLREEAPPASSPHVILVALTRPRERDWARCLAAVRTVSGALVGGGDGGARGPDAIVAAGCGALARRSGALAAAMREAYPEAAVFVLRDDHSRRGAGGLDGIFALPADLRSSWARRLPPGDPFFDEVAGGLLQVVSLRRKKGGARAQRAS